MKTIYTFNKKDKGYIGDAFEMEIKRALGFKDCDSISTAGKTDIKYGKYYEVKQNGGVMKYHDSTKMFVGSSRVIYATHVSYTVVAETEETISLTVDLTTTDMFVLDKKAFIKFLTTTEGFCKENKQRNEINIQTMYNYKKDAYHGRKGKILEAWADENKLFDDDIIEQILDGCYAN